MVGKCWIDSEICIFFIKVLLFHSCHPPYILSPLLLSSLFILILILSVHLFVFSRASLSSEKRKMHSNEWSHEKLQKGLFLSHCSKPVITTFVCALCLQDKGKADGNIDQCEYTYCVQTKQHFSKYAMLCSMTNLFFFFFICCYSGIYFGFMISRKCWWEVIQI